MGFELKGPNRALPNPIAGFQKLNRIGAHVRRIRAVPLFTSLKDIDYFREYAQNAWQQRRERGLHLEADTVATVSILSI